MHTGMILDEFENIGRNVDLMKVGGNINNEWENELDALGVNAPASKYLEMLEKAPVFSSSKQALTQHIQQIMSA